MFWNNTPYAYNFGGFNTPYNCTPGFNSWSTPSQFSGWNGMNSYGNSFPQGFTGWNTPAWNSQSCFGGSCTPWNYSGQSFGNWGWNTPGSFIGSNYDWNCSFPQNYAWDWNSQSFPQSIGGFSFPQSGFGSFPSAWNTPSFGGFDYQNCFGGQQIPFGYQNSWNMPYGGFGTQQYPGFAHSQSGTPGFAGQPAPGGFNPSVVRDAA